jgi:hypothetical protein
MDPYLENPIGWRDVHHELISCIRAHLAAKLRPHYAVRVEERVYVEPEDDPFREQLRFPDVHIVRHRPGRRRSSGTTTVASPIETMTMGDAELSEARVVVRDPALGKAITVIEVLSPSNKTPGSAGRSDFLKKRREVLQSATHWVEIDLLRAGTPPDGNRWGQTCDYIVHVSRSDCRPRGKLWRILIRQPLPTIDIPLSEPDEVAALDLQAVLKEGYDRAGYDGVVDYSADPNPPLSRADAAWAEALLRRAGLRRRRRRS